MNSIVPLISNDKKPSTFCLFIEC